MHVIYTILSSHAKNQPPRTMLSYVYTLFKFPGNFYNLSFQISEFRFWFKEYKRFFLQFLVDILPLGSGSLDPHIFADPDPDPESQNLEDPTDPDPKHCWHDHLIFLRSCVFKCFELINRQFKVSRRLLSAEKQTIFSF